MAATAIRARTEGGYTVFPMRARPLTTDFFARNTLDVARELIGAVIEVGDVSGRIVETEAYRGDPASHFVTRPRTGRMMGTTHGHLYVYSIYGMHHCVNVTTERDHPGAVLLRAIEPLTGLDEMSGRRGGRTGRDIGSGPAKLVVALGIRPDWTGRPVDDELTIRARTASPDIATGPRIGISQAVELPWRFYERGNLHVSRARRVTTP